MKADLVVRALPGPYLHNSPIQTFIDIFIDILNRLYSPVNLDVNVSLIFAG